MSLPQELIDKIFSHLSLDEPQTLRNCSLVAKSWVYPSQKKLFETVCISSSTHSSWADRISPANIELLLHVRSITYTLDMASQFHFPAYRIDSISDYLPSFHNLESLILSSIDLRSKLDISQQVRNFSAFQHTLASLSLWGCSISSGALTTVVNYFPNLAGLQLRAPIYRPAPEPVPLLSRPLRGRLSIQLFMTKDIPVLDRLSDLPPELDELAICGLSSRPMPYNRIVATYAGGVKHLRLLRGVAGER